MTPTPHSADAHAADMHAVQLWGRVIRGFQATNRALHEAVEAQFALDETETETLLSLIRAEEHRAPMSSLARATAFSTGGFTKVADRLHERGLVQRAACDHDRRVTYLGLTDEGLALAHDLVAFVAAQNRERFIEVLGAERADLVAVAMTELFRANSGASR